VCSWIPLGGVQFLQYLPKRLDFGLIPACHFWSRIWVIRKSQTLYHFPFCSDSDPCMFFRIQIYYLPFFGGVQKWPKCPQESGAQNIGAYILGNKIQFDWTSPGEFRRNAPHQLILAGMTFESHVPKSPYFWGHTHRNLLLTPLSH